MILFLMFQVLRQVVKLREINPELKVLLSIVHFSNGSHTNEGFSDVVASKENLFKYDRFLTVQYLIC
jgi:hypothetical protein